MLSRRTCLSRKMDLRSYRSRRTLVTLVLFLALGLLAVYLPLTTLQRSHLRVGIWRRPPKLSKVYRQRRPLNATAADGDDWTHPRILAAWGIPYNRLHDRVQLFVATQGLFLRSHGWQLSIVGCLVGNELFPRRHEFSGVFVCHVNRSISSEEQISVVINKTSTVQSIMMGIKPVRGAKIAYNKGDLIPVDSQTVKAFSESLAEPLHVDLVAVRAGVTWSTYNMDIVEDDSDSIPSRYEICIMTQEKAYPEDLEQWVDYHRRIGVDMVYIYDNVAERDLADMFRNRTDVEVVFWPFVKSQLQAHNHFLSLARRRCEWALLVDVDEYVMVGKAGGYVKVGMPPLKQYLALKREQGYSSVYLRDIIMGPSGHHYRPNSSIAEAYTYLNKDKLPLGKVAVWTDGIKPDSFVHRVNLLHGHRSNKPRRPREGGDGSLKLSSREGYLIHFKYRSWEDYVRKGWFGRNSIMVADWNVSFGSGSWRVEKPPDWFLSLESKVPFVQFRDYWRRVMTTAQARPPQNLVCIHAKIRCVVTVDTDREGGLLHSVCQTTERTGFDKPDYVMLAKDFNARANV